MIFREYGRQITETDFAFGDEERHPQAVEATVMKSIITNALVILVAAAGLIFLLKHGGDAGASGIKQITAPVRSSAATAAPVRLQTIQGQVDNFNEAIALQPIQSWAANVKYGFLLALSDDSTLNQSHARVTFAHPPAAPIVLEIQYTVPQNIFDMIQANAETKSQFNGVAVEVATNGSNNTNSVLLNLDPLRRAEDRKWLSYNFIVPTGTKDVRFWIARLPPDYKAFRDSCAISLPQLRMMPSNVSAIPGATPTPTAAGP